MKTVMGGEKDKRRKDHEDPRSKIKSISVLLTSQDSRDRPIAKGMLSMNVVVNAE